MTIPWTEAPPDALPALLPDVTAAGVYWQANATAFLLEAPGVARYYVQDGRLTCARLGGADEAVVTLYGGGLPIAAAWVQRGCLALHAAAVATPQGAVVIAGPSAAGKSVLAATLARRGCALLADEVTPVKLAAGAGSQVLPNTDGALLLWHDAVEHLGLAAGTLAPVRPGLSRFAVPGFATAAAQPLRAIYLLGLHNGADIRVSPLGGRDVVLSVIAAAFNRYLPQSPEQRQRTLLQLTVQIGALPVRRLLRPRAGWSAQELAERLLEDLAA